MIRKMSGEMEMSSKNESRKTAYIEEVEEVHTQPVLDYLDRPRNIEIMRNFDGEGQATAQSNKWEATIWIYLKVREGKIWKATWFSTGIGELITAYGSALTEMVKGKTIREALWIRPEEISASLDLPETGFGVWVKGALLEAINNYNIYKSAPWTKIYEQKC